MKIPGTNLASLRQEQLEAWVTAAMVHCQSGQLPSYIPRLAEAERTDFALQILGIGGQVYSVGNGAKSFPLMSTIKPFVLLYLLCKFGTGAVFDRVGCEASEQPFNALSQLQLDGGRPRNPMINSGAIALASMIPGQGGWARCETLCSWLNQQGNCQLFLDELMLASVYSAPNPYNQAIAFELASSGYVEDAQSALDTYNHICCLSGTIGDLARLGMLLVQPPNPAWSEYTRIVKAIMTTCGLYQAASQFAVQVGLPTKSGVSGAILSAIPRQGAIACYSPPLDPNGNSVVGLLILEQIAQALRLSVFD